MSNPTPQQYAYLADDTYNVRVVTGDKGINIGGRDYKVIAVHANPRNGYYGAVYQDVQTNAVIVAHRGTEGLSDWKTNAGIVANKINNQAADAEELTALAIDEVNKIYRKDPGKPRPTITQTGHSLGGNHAQTQAYRHNQQGVTFNAYGAAGMYGIPEGGSSVTNYIKVSDPVAAAAPHYGREILLAAEDDIARIRQQGYNNQTNTIASRAFIASGWSVGAHSIGNFTGSRSILDEPAHTRARKLAEENRHMIEDYRKDVEKVRGGMHNIKQNIDESQKMYDKTREIIDKDPNMMSYNGFAPHTSETTPALTPYAQAAMDNGRACFTKFCDYYNIDYPKDKLDNISAAIMAYGRAADMRDVSKIDVDGDSVL